MSEHKATVHWKRATESFEFEHYNREHHWKFENGIHIPASSAPGFLGNPECVDPEEGLTAALSACHMLTFLAIASKKKFIVDEYKDQPVGFLEKNEEGKMSVTRIELHPVVKFSGEKRPTKEEIERLHESAHRNCFIANSIKSEVTWS